MTVVGFAIVAAAATLLRVLATAGQPAGQIPWRTLGVNCAGAFALGLLVASDWIDNPVLAATAGLGSFTTFSTVAAEAAGLLDDGEKRRSVAYVGLTVALGVAAALLGLMIGDST